MSRSGAIGTVLALALAAAAPAFAQAPRISAFTPNSGPPGTLVKIVGEGLGGITAVHFHGVEARVVYPISDEHLKAVVPEGATTGPIGVVNGEGLRAFTIQSFEVTRPLVLGPPLALAIPRPSPAAGSVTLGFGLPTADHVRLAIYDLRGRLVRRLVDEPLAPGAYERAWDARDDPGRRMPPGVYFARLEVGLQARLQRVVLLR